MSKSTSQPTWGAEIANAFATRRTQRAAINDGRLAEVVRRRAIADRAPQFLEQLMRELVAGVAAFNAATGQELLAFGLQSDGASVRFCGADCSEVWFLITPAYADLESLPTLRLERRCSGSSGVTYPRLIAVEHSTELALDVSGDVYDARRAAQAILSSFIAAVPV